MRFIPKSHHVFVGPVWSDPDNRHDKEETDHYLYFDSNTLGFFVEENTSFVSGPDVSVHHSVKDLTQYLQEHPERREAVSRLIAQKISGAPK